MQPAPEPILAKLYPLLHRRMLVALTAYFGFASLADAEDLVQETFATALKDWRSRGIPEQPEKWLFKVCKNNALNFLKKQKNRPTSPYASPQTGPDGALIELEHQDRSLWRQDMIQLGIRHLNQSLGYRHPLSRYQLEALIASLHSTAPSFRATDWHKIVGFYDLLLQVSPGPYMALNKAIALYFSEGSKAALAYLASSPYRAVLEEYHLYYTFIGRLSRENGELQQAREHYARGLALAKNQLEKAFFVRKLDQIDG